MRVPLEARLPYAVLVYGSGRTIWTKYFQMRGLASVVGDSVARKYQVLFVCFPAVSAGLCRPESIRSAV